MTICLFILLVITLKINVQANDNTNEHELPTAGFSDFISTIDVDDIEITVPYTMYLINNHNGMKTYMSYKTLTSTTSGQYALQQEAYTDSEGFRKIDNRYLVAIGTAFGAEVGQEFDAILENGTVIECIVGDIKADKDTDKTNTFTSQGCCLEFIVDTAQLNHDVKVMGDCSYLCEEWDSPCFQYKIYDIIIL